MVPITEERNGDLHIAPTGQKREGIAAWLGENFGLGMMVMGTAMAMFTLFSGGTSLVTTLLGSGAAWWQTLGLSLGILGTGGAVGAYFDKQKNDENAVEGVTVSKPSFFNRGILTEGLLKGGLNGIVMAVALMGVAGMLGAFGVPLIGGLSIAGLTASYGTMVPVTIAAISGLVGAVRGSMERKEKMEKTYDQVQAAYFMQTGQVEKAQGLMQKLGIAAPALAAGAGVGVGMVAGAKSKALAVDPATVKHAVASGLGLQDAMSPQEQLVASNPYDFGHLEDHPAMQARKSFAQEVLERRSAMGVAAENQTLH